MDEPLRLEYACTPEELKQVQDLQVTAQLGRGSKFRAVAILVAVFGFLVLVASVKFLAIDPAFRPALLIVPAVIIGSLIALAYLRRKRETNAPDDDLKCLLEITSREVRLAGPTGWAIVPWNGFGKLVESETLFVLPDASGYQLLVLPKRVFPGEQASAWFREQAQRAETVVSSFAATLPEDADLPAEPGSVRVEVLLRLSDYFDRALASWKTRGFMILFGVLMLGTFVAAMLQPAPHAVFSKAEVFFYFCLPFLCVIELVIFLTLTLYTWLQHRSLLKTQSITLSPAGVSYSQSDGRASTEWTANARYKETPWSFFLWWEVTGVRFQLPKRAFTTVHDADRCRQLLSANAKQTTWYFG